MNSAQMALTIDIRLNHKKGRYHGPPEGWYRGGFELIWYCFDIMEPFQAHSESKAHKIIEMLNFLVNTSVNLGDESPFKDFNYWKPEEMAPQVMDAKMEESEAKDRLNERNCPAEVSLASDILNAKDKKLRELSRTSRTRQILDIRA
jgi:hypothetical protein